MRITVPLVAAFALGPLALPAQQTAASNPQRLAFVTITEPTPAAWLPDLHGRERETLTFLPLVPGNEQDQRGLRGARRPCVDHPPAQ